MSPFYLIVIPPDVTIDLCVYVVFSTVFKKASCFHFLAFFSGPRMLPNLLGIPRNCRGKSVGNVNLIERGRHLTKLLNFSISFQQESY